MSVPSMIYIVENTTSIIYATTVKREVTEFLFNNIDNLERFKLTKWSNRKKNKITYTGKQEILENIFKNKHVKDKK